MVIIGLMRGKEELRERNLLARQIPFVFPQTADTIFDLIRFKDIPSLRTLLADSPILSSVSRHIK